MHSYFVIATICKADANLLVSIISSFLDEAAFGDIYILIRDKARS